MGWELHGLDLLFTVCRAARLANFAGMTKVCRDGRLQDRVGISVARAWLRNCSTSSNAQMDAACALSPAAAEAAGAATTALFHVLSQLWTGGHTLKLQRSRRSAHPGPASEKAGTGWYGIVPLDAPRTAGSHTSTTWHFAHKVPPCQLLANEYSITHDKSWGTAPADIQSNYTQLNCTTSSM
jgi:hypothetical protein